MDGIEKEHEDELVVLRVNIQSDAGRALGSYFHASMTPTFIFFDANGVEQWRSIGTLNRDQVEKYISGSR